MAVLDGLSQLIFQRQTTSPSWGFLTPSLSIWHITTCPGPIS